MAGQTGRAFNEWLRAQLKAKKMSQRQLAQQSGVDHSTISRLIRGDRMPSLGTATKLARGLREIRDDAEAPQYLGAVASGAANPTARIEYALRADEFLSEPQVRQVMEYYLAVRMRRFGRTYTGPRTDERTLEPRRILDDRRERPTISAVAGRSLYPLSHPLPPRARETVVRERSVVENAANPARLRAEGGELARVDGRPQSQHLRPLVGVPTAADRQIRESQGRRADNDRG
jgi:transcriptional regulator with XRE-family HTH domain